LVVALVRDLAFWAPFSWFIGAAISAVVYYVIARGSIRYTPSSTHTSLPA
jgi:cytosine/uracil/thiamine/allantoin permease